MHRAFITLPQAWDWGWGGGKGLAESKRVEIDGFVLEVSRNISQSCASPQDEDGGMVAKVVVDGLDAGEAEEEAVADCTFLL